MNDKKEVADEQEKVVQSEDRVELTKEEKQEVIDATLELINAYELDIECLFDSSVKVLCTVIKTEEDFNNVVSKIKDLQEKLSNEYDYVYESEFVNLSYSDTTGMSLSLLLLSLLAFFL